MFEIKTELLDTEVLLEVDAHFFEAERSTGNPAYWEITTVKLYGDLCLELDWQTDRT